MPKVLDFPSIRLFDPEPGGGRPVIRGVAVVAGESATAAHHLDLPGRAGARVIGVGVGRSHDRVGLAAGTDDVRAPEGQGGRECALGARGQHDDSVDDAGGRRAAVGVGWPAGRYHVDVNADRVGVIAFISYLDNEVLGIGLPVTQNDAARGGDLL